MVSDSLVQARDYQSRYLFHDGTFLHEGSEHVVFDAVGGGARQGDQLQPADQSRVHDSPVSAQLTRT